MSFQLRVSALPGRGKQSEVTGGQSVGRATWVPHQDLHLTLGPAPAEAVGGTLLLYLLQSAEAENVCGQGGP